MICPIAKKKELNNFFENVLPEMNITYELINWIYERKLYSRISLIRAYGYLILTYIKIQEKM